MSATDTPAKATVFENVEKPELDKRSYRFIKLENELECLLVHDPETDKASAALDVHVGHLSDPWDAAGLAHFCEHLLFMGTTKYPRENDYNEYLSSHSGQSNAFTGTVDTNYFFEVGHAHLEGALDRFAQFFICPLFLASCKERELLAVDSENKKNLQSDQWRAYQLEKSLSNPDHVYAKFGTGNYHTLKEVPESKGKDVRDELLKFHSEYYSANQMKLVVLGRHGLDELDAMVRGMFAEVRNKSLPSPSFDGEILRAGQELGTVYTFKPVKDTRQLEVCFPIPDCDPMWRSQPSHYLSHLLGHEGEGSALSYLKQKGWVLYLGAGGNNAAPGTDLFKISLEVTREGLTNWQQIVVVLFTYIHLMRSAGPQRWIWDENRLCAEADFRFQDQRAASRFTSSTAGKMQKPTDRRFILGASVPREYREDDIRRCLDALNVDNFRVAVADPEAVTDRAEQWYGTEYRIEKLSTHLLEQCANPAPLNELHLPRKNEFIPERFDTGRKEVAKVERPYLIKHTPLLRLWHKKDDTFWVPKANYLASIRLPAARRGAKEAVMAKLYVELLKDALNEYAYPADIAGLQYDLERTASGVNLVFGGYDDKMPVLVDKVLRRMVALAKEVDSVRFGIEKEKLQREFANFEYEMPYQQVGYHMSLAIAPADTAFAKQAQADALASVRFEDLQAFAGELFKQAHVELLAHGNVSEADAEAVAALFEEVLADAAPLAEADTMPEPALSITLGGRSYVRALKDPKNVNSALEYYLETCGDLADGVRAQTALLAQICQEPAFDTLRTKEQLGYVVFSGLRVSLTSVGLRFIVQSERDPAYVEARIDAFLITLRAHIAQLSDEEFDKQKRSLTDKINERLKNLKSETRLYWAYMTAGRYRFDERAVRTKDVNAVTKEQLLQLFDEKIAPNAKGRQKLAVWLRAHGSHAAFSAGAVKAAVLALVKERKLVVDQSVVHKVIDEAFATNSSAQAVSEALVDRLSSVLPAAPVKSTDDASAEASESESIEAAVGRAIAALRAAADVQSAQHLIHDDGTGRPLTGFRNSLKPMGRPQPVDWKLHYPPSSSSSSSSSSSGSAEAAPARANGLALQGETHGKNAEGSKL